MTVKSIILWSNKLYYHIWVHVLISK